MNELTQLRRRFAELKYEAASLRANLRVDSADSNAQLPLVIMAERRTFSLAECETQYKADTFHCAMVGLPNCHRHGAQRYAACLGGTQIAPLSY